MKPDENVLKRERGTTDSSLKEERSETDGALRRELELVKYKTDRDRTASRDKADATTKNNRSAGNRDRALVGERHSADTALAKERAETDAATENERRKMHAATEDFLVRERGATDSDLLKERQSTDRHLKTHKRAREDAQAALTTRDEFLAIVSHDLRNPLGAISASAQLLRGSLADDLVGAGEKRGLLAIIERNTRFMDRLIQDLLDLERMASGKMEVVPVEFDLRGLVKDCTSSLQAGAAEKSIELEIRLPDEPLLALIDADRITQVLGNLVANAIKFTGANGHVIVDARPCGDHQEICVSDTGVGIGAKEQHVIFERFSQLSRNDRQGLGLGLYIARWIVEEHGGAIWVQSQPGQGSQFFFTVPAA